MGLKKDLEKQAAISGKMIVPETLNLLTADTERLRQSGIVDNSLKTGDKMPSFALPDVRGQQISSGKLFKRG